MSTAKLFDEQVTLRAVVESALEGVLGEVMVEGDATPLAARLTLGCYAVFGGKATAGEDLVRSARAPVELIAPQDQRWRDLLFEVWGERLVDRPMRTYASPALEQRHLDRLAARVPQGYRVEPLTLESARQLDEGLAPHALQVFRDAEHFVERGLGFGVVKEGRVVAASTSYAISSGSVEVSISTRIEHRGLGLATAVAACMVSTCLRLGKRPDWSASNPVSKHIATKLGYRPAALCDVLYLESLDPPQPR